MKLLKISTDSTISVVDISGHTGPFHQKLSAELGVDSIEHVNARSLMQPYCLYIDEEGLLKESVKVNPIASYLYGYLEHSQKIVGDVLIGKNVMTEEGPDWGCLKDGDVQALIDMFRIMSRTRWQE